MSDATGGFAKIFRTLWEGSMLGHADAQLVFVFMLAHASPRGDVDVTQEFVAALTGLPVERVHAAVAHLEAADARSRSPEEDGRRLVPLTPGRGWGWRVVNFAKYRAMRGAEARREWNRERMRAARQAPAAPKMRQPPARPRTVAGVDTEPRGAAFAVPEASLAFGGVESVTEPEQVRAESQASARREWLREFDEYFWKHYPRKVAKDEARRAWAALTPKEQATLDRVMTGLARWCSRHREEIEEPGQRHVPHPATWLRSGRYDDTGE